MNIFKNFDWSFKSIAKIIGLLILGIITLTVVIALISFSIKTIFGTASYNQGYDGYDYAMDEAVEFGKGGGAPVMATSRMIMTPIPEPGYTTGDDAEEYEVKEYYGTIKTRKLDETCAVIADLKVRDDVIFESSDKNKESCRYRFKVKKEINDEIVEIIESLKPENFNASVDTIKGTIERYDN